MTVTPELGKRRVRRIGGGWSVSLAEFRSSMFNERPYCKVYGRRQLEDTQMLTYGLHIYVHTETKNNNKNKTEVFSWQCKF